MAKAEQHIIIDDVDIHAVLNRRTNIAALSKMIDTIIWLVENGYYKDGLDKKNAMSKILDLTDQLKLQCRKNFI